MLIIAILAVICGADGFKELTINVEQEIIALDGKTVRGSGNKRRGHPALHLVSAWAAQHRLMLGQVKTEDKSNEITAIPKLLISDHTEPICQLQH